MEYIWETIGQESDKYFFKQAEVFGPYSEVTGVTKDESLDGQTVVEYNSLFRYNQIFADMLILQENQGEWTKYFFDACTHLLMYVDGLEGLNQKELQVRRFMHLVHEGKCLKQIKSKYEKISPQKQYEIANYYILQEQIGESVLLYGRAVTSILETGVVYKCTISPKELLVYLGEKMNEEKKLIWEILNYCFLPVSYDVRLYEQTHIGLLDENQTMQYEYLELF